MRKPVNLINHDELIDTLRNTAERINSMTTGDLYLVYEGGGLFIRDLQELCGYVPAIMYELSFPENMFKLEIWDWEFVIKYTLHGFKASMERKEN